MSAAAPSRTVVAASSVFAIIFGAGVAAQSRINGELGRQLDNGFFAAFVSFGSGLVILTVAMLIVKSGRTGLKTVVVSVRDRGIPWWYVLGGAAGSFLVLSQGVTASIVGVALFTVSIVAGQTISGLVIDRRGLGSMAAKPITVTRLAGSVLVLVAVGFAALSQLNATFPLWVLIMPLLAGLGVGWQQAVNGQVREVAGSALTATFVNFIVGAVVLFAITFIHSFWGGWPTVFPSTPWLYLGGPIGVIFIAGAAIVVRNIGVLLLGLAMIAGQLLASVVLDLVAPVAGHTLAASTVISAAVTIVAVGIAALPARRPRTIS